MAHDVDDGAALDVKYVLGEGSAFHEAVLALVDRVFRDVVERVRDGRRDRFAVRVAEIKRS